MSSPRRKAIADDGTNLTINGNITVSETLTIDKDLAIFADPVIKSIRKKDMALLTTLLVIRSIMQVFYGRFKKCFYFKTLLKDRRPFCKKPVSIAGRMCFLPFPGGRVCYNRLWRKL